MHCLDMKKNHVDMNNKRMAVQYGMMRLTEDKELLKMEGTAMLKMVEGTAMLKNVEGTAMLRKVEGKGKWTKVEGKRYWMVEGKSMLMVHHVVERMEQNLVAFVSLHLHSAL